MRRGHCCLGVAQSWCWWSLAREFLCPRGMRFMEIHHGIRVIMVRGSCEAKFGFGLIPILLVVFPISCSPMATIFLIRIILIRLFLIYWFSDNTLHFCAPSFFWVEREWGTKQNETSEPLRTLHREEWGVFGVWQSLVLISCWTHSYQSKLKFTSFRFYDLQSYHEN